jgi:hypothetical protein
MALNRALQVVAGLVPATSIVDALRSKFGVAGTSPATTRSMIQSERNAL